jgi:hypothetical protein
MSAHSTAVSDPEVPSRLSHPCLERTCGHAAEDHLGTPELAGGGESVAWCTRCLRHEVRGPSWGRSLRGVLGRRARPRASRPD